MKLNVSDLTFAYEEKPVLNKLCLDVAEGEFVSLLGASGCGKSTLLKVLTGVLTPDGGSVSVDGVPVTGISEHFAYMPQNDLLFPWKTILQNVCLYAQIHGGIKEAEAEAVRQMAEFGLEGYEYSYPSELSGGMRQRAAFLRTMLCKADILLLDEPFGALDVITRGEMQDWLSGIRRKMSRTVVLVTHDIDEAIYLSDRILILSAKTGTVGHELRITEQHRDRPWLYAQGELRQQIHMEILGEQSGIC